MRERETDSLCYVSQPLLDYIFSIKLKSVSKTTKLQKEV